MSDGTHPSRCPAVPDDDSAVLLNADADADDYELELDLLDQSTPTTGGL